MKSKLAIILVASITFAAGYFLGCDRTQNLMRKSWAQSYLYWNRVYSSQELERTILILTQFREGNSTNGISMLEKCLDGSLLGTASIDAELNDRTDGVPTYIQEARDYRAKNPWTNSNAKVQAILSREK